MSNFYQKKAKKYKLKYLNLLNQLGGSAGDCKTREAADAQINSELTKNGVKHIEMDDYNRRLSELMCEEQPQNTANTANIANTANTANIANTANQPLLLPQKVQQYSPQPKIKDQVFIANVLRFTLQNFRNNINPFRNEQQNEPLLKEIDKFIDEMNNKIIFFSYDCNCDCNSLKQNNTN